jgi:cytoskeletal protein CcmA (bactofilin family)
MQMFSKKEVTTTFDLVIGPNSLVNGNLESEASVRIDGTVIGNIISKGNVILSERGRIEGNIICDSLEIHGQCIGNVKSKGRIDLTKSSKLVGDIICMTLNTETGAKFEGNCRVLPETKIEIVTQIDKGNKPADLYDAFENDTDSYDEVANM